MATPVNSAGEESILDTTLGWLAVVLAFCFRCLKGVLVPLSSVAISVLWTLATIAALGYSLNIVTVLVPSLLMILSLSYSIHVVSEFLETAGETTDRQSLASLAASSQAASLGMAQLIGENHGRGFVQGSIQKSLGDGLSFRHLRLCGTQ